MNPSSYLRFLRHHLPGINFGIDGSWSWVMALVAFAYHIFIVGIVHCLGVFFKPWMIAYGATEGKGMSCLQ